MLQSLAAFDVLSSITHQDLISGTNNDDTLDGTADDDQIRGLNGDDIIHGLDGDDTLLGGKGDDLLSGGTGDDVLDGGAGIDRASFFGAAKGVKVDLNIADAQNTGWGHDQLIGIEDVSGTQFNDKLVGDANDNWLWGQVGGNDNLTGNDGNDLLEVARGDHTLNGGAGFDTVSFDSNGAGLLSDSHVDLNIATAQDTGNGMMTLKGVEGLSGSATDVVTDVFIGDATGNFLGGGQGDDSLAGNGGNDALWGDGIINVDDQPSGASGPITQFLGFGDGVDTIDGGAGDDTIIGGAGGDQMTGGKGADTFLFANLSDMVAGGQDEGPVDRILDFDKSDTISFAPVDADGDPGNGQQPLSLVTEFTGAGGEMTATFQKASGYTILQIDFDGDQVADYEIDVHGHIAPGQYIL